MVSTRYVILITVGAAVLCLGIGLLLGYVFIPNPCEPKNCSGTDQPTNGSTQPTDGLDTDTGVCGGTLPRHYITYHLRSGERINIDGEFNEDAWAVVQWTEDFADLRGAQYPIPSQRTRVKIRWDDTYVYIAAELMETDLWATKTEHDTFVWTDNAFEVYFDADGSCHNYKELQVNALNTTWDLRLSKAYIDGGSAVSAWESDMVVRVSADGPVNNPTQTSTFWNVEMAIPFSNLIQNTLQTLATPSDMDIWRIVLARPEWKFNIINDSYVKNESLGADWWSWTPHGAIALHLPDRWGLLQFSRAEPNTQAFKTDTRWLVSRALFDVFNALQAYHAVYGMYVADMQLLEVPRYLLEGKCGLELPQIELPSNVAYTFYVTVRLLNGDASQTGYIRSDRLTWFGNKTIGVNAP